MDMAQYDAAEALFQRAEEWGGTASELGETLVGLRQLRDAYRQIGNADAAARVGEIIERLQARLK